jgi:hypothetical protein
MIKTKVSVHCEENEDLGRVQNIKNNGVLAKGPFKKVINNGVLARNAFRIGGTGRKALTIHMCTYIYIYAYTCLNSQQRTLEGPH